MGLKVIGAGMGRTGTHSLKLALEQLGFGPCHHMFEVREKPAQLAYWQAVARNESPGWEKIFADYVSQVDWPGARYWEEIAQAFPTAKVILTYREPEAWYASFSQTIVHANTLGRTHDPNPHTRAMAELLNEIVFDQLFSGKLHDKEHVLKVYADHIGRVQRTIPPERLLTFNVQEGWAPLCRFLEVPVPDRAFPKTNSKDEFLQRKAFLKDLAARQGKAESRDTAAATEPSKQVR